MYIRIATNMIKTIFKGSSFKNVINTTKKRLLALQFEAIDLPDFLKTAIILASFQNDGKHFFLRDKLNSLQSGRQNVFLVAINIRD